MSLGATPYPPKIGRAGSAKAEAPPAIFPTQKTDDEEIAMKLSGDRNQCQGCLEFFNSTRAFDKHREGQHGRDRRCLTPTEMLGKGMAKNAAGFWVGSPMPEEIKQLVAA